MTDRSYTDEKGINLFPALGVNLFNNVIMEKLLRNNKIKRRKWRKIMKR